VSDPLHCVWRFVRGDTDVAAFRTHLALDVALREVLGATLVQAVDATDLGDDAAVWALRCSLGEWARAQPGPPCLCVRFRDLDRFDWGGFFDPPPSFEQDRDWSHLDVRASWDVLAEHGPPLWWLSHARCRVCAQDWLVAFEQEQNDVYVIRRMSADEARDRAERRVWPAALNSYAFLLAFGGANVRVTFVDPGDSTLVETATRLARERPGLGLPELGALLDLHPADARRVAVEAIARAGVDIDLRDP
jgi:hypothetical protein